MHERQGFVMENKEICTQSANRSLLPVRNKNWRSYLGQCLVGLALRATQDRDTPLASLNFSVADNTITMTARGASGQPQEREKLHQSIANLIASNFIEGDNPIFADIFRANAVTVESQSGLTLRFHEEDAMKMSDMADYLTETLPGYALNGVSLSLDGAVLSRGASHEPHVNEVTVNGPDTRSSTTFAVHNKANDTNSIVISRLGIPLFSVPAAQGRTGALDIVGTSGDDYFLPTARDMISGLTHTAASLPSKIMSLNAQAVRAQSFDENLRPVFLEGGLINKLPQHVVDNLTPEDTKKLITYEIGNAVYNLYPFHVNSAMTDGLVDDATPGHLTVPKKTMELIDRWRFAGKRANEARKDNSSFSVGLTDMDSHVGRDDLGNPIFYVGQDAHDWSDQRMDAKAAQHVTASLNLPLHEQLEEMTSIIAEMSKDMTVMRMRNIMRETIGGDCLIFYTDTPQSRSPVAALIDFVWPEHALAREIPSIEQTTAEPFQGEWRDDAWTSSTTTPDISLTPEQEAPSSPEQPEDEVVEETEPERVQEAENAQPVIEADEGNTTHADLFEATLDSVAPAPQEPETTTPVEPEPEPENAQVDSASNEATALENAENTAFSTDGIPASLEDIFAEMDEPKSQNHTAEKTSEIPEEAPPAQPPEEAPAPATPITPSPEVEADTTPAQTNSEEHAEPTQEEEALSDFDAVLSDFNIGGVETLIAETQEAKAEPSLTVIDTVAIEEAGRQAVKAIDLSRAPVIAEQEDEVTFSRGM